MAVVKDARRTGGTAMPEDGLAVLRELFEPTPTRKQLARAAREEHGYYVLEAKTHPRTRLLRDTRTKPTEDAMEMAATAAMRGATVLEPINRRDVYTKTGGICYLCGRKIHINVFAIDHVIPLYWGGNHIWANLLPACHPCNELKAARPVAVEIATGHTLVL